MQLLIAHLLVFLQISIASLFFSLSGFLLKFLVLKKKDANNFYENGLFGFVLIGFISLGLNFFPIGYTFKQYCFFSNFYFIF